MTTSIYVMGDRSTEVSHPASASSSGENRLLSSDDNGFVTNYWYDADGERTVKT